MDDLGVPLFLETPKWKKTPPFGRDGHQPYPRGLYTYYVGFSYQRWDDQYNTRW